MGLSVQKTGSAPVVPPLRLLLATLGDRLVAFEADAVRGSIETEDPEWDKGVTAEGILYEAVDLANRLALPFDPDGVGVKGSILLLSQGVLRGCVRVARLHGVAECEPAQILPLSPHFHGVERQWYRGMILFEHTVAMVLNAVWVLEGVRSGQDGANLERQPEVLPPSTTIADLALSKVQEC